MKVPYYLPIFTKTSHVFPYVSEVPPPQRKQRLENTASVSEGGDVAGRVLLVHGLASELLSDHVSDDSEHGGASVVQLSVELAGLLLGVLDVGSEVSDAVISVVLGGGHPGDLDEGADGEDLDEAGRGDGKEAADSGGDVRELEVVGRRNVSVKDNVVVVDDRSEGGNHGNAAVLALDGPAALEGLGLAVKPSERVVDAKGLSNS